MTASDQPEKPNPSTGSDSANSNETFTGEEPLSAASVSPNSIEGLFLRALQIESPKERDEFISRSCGDDAERRKRVTALLRAYDDAGSFLETPAGGVRPTDEVSLSFLKATNKEGVLGTIGPYEVLEVIGRGGMGVVLRAVDPKLNRVVAVKALLPELAANPNSRRRFLREAQAAAAISHPHVVTIHAVDDTHEDANGKPVPPYLVMECVIGQSLQEKLDRVGTLRLAEILRIGRQIGEGLAAAHKQGVIHRDIKPGNILLENGVERVKITDFGLARAIDDITVTRTGEVSGTPQYMSPEQACGERVDHRSDLFSLGCVMYAICTGHSPFRGDSIAHVIKRVTQDTPRPIADQNPEIPPWLIEIITCLLQKDPEHRFQSAEGVVAILDQHLARIQHPTESGSHSVINQQVPNGVAPVAANTEMPRWLLTPVLPGGRSQIGVVLIGLGATILFSMVTWMLLVAFDVIGASQEVRGNAPLIAGWCLLATFLSLAAGLLLRKQILGHETWTDLLKLTFYSTLGPFGIGYWMLQRMNPVRKTAFTATASRSGWKRNNSFLISWLLLAILSIAAGPAIRSWIRGGSQLSQADVERISNIVAQRFHQPIKTVTSTGNGTALVIIPSPDGQQRIYTKRNAGIWELDPAHHATTFEIGKGDTLGPANSEWGGLILDTEDIGIHVALIGTGPRIIGFQPPLIPAGRHKIPVGGYIPLFFDTQAGWLNDVKSSPQGEYEKIYKTIDEVFKGLKTGAAPYDAEPGTYAFALYTASPPHIDVQPGKFATVFVRRDLKKIAEGSGYFNRDAAERFMPDQFYRFLWNGTKYSLSDEQAKVVDVLLHAMADGKPSCSKEVILKAFDKSKFHPASVKFVFNNGSHPAWGELIIVSEDGKPDHFRLVPLADSTTKSRPVIAIPPAMQGPAPDRAGEGDLSN